MTQAASERKRNLRPQVALISSLWPARHNRLAGAELR
jgi:hypothetical protein